jgi:hypothetical protein
MTNAELRTIISDAAAAFGPGAIEEACAAAIALAQGDDSYEYASSVAEAVRRVLEANLKKRRAETLALERQTALIVRVNDAMLVSVGPRRH